jgi:long-chain acyl-CoA synthetase
MQVMLVGQDQKFLSALVVVSPSNLQARGLISKEKALHLMSIIGSTPTSTGPVGDVEVLRTEADLLHANPTAYNAVMEDIQKICAKFQRWEQVRSVRLLLEPFSVANGLLTQTLKVKRNVVAERYHAEIDKFYGKRGQMLSES